MSTGTEPMVYNFTSVNIIFFWCTSHHVKAMIVYKITSDDLRQNSRPFCLGLIQFGQKVFLVK